MSTSPLSLAFLYVPFGNPLSSPGQSSFQRGKCPGPFSIISVVREKRSQILRVRPSYAHSPDRVARHEVYAFCVISTQVKRVLPFFFSALGKRHAWRPSMALVENNKLDLEIRCPHGQSRIKCRQNTLATQLRARVLCNKDAASADSVAPKVRREQEP